VNNIIRLSSLFFAGFLGNRFRGRSNLNCDNSCVYDDFFIGHIQFTPMFTGVSVMLRHDLKGGQSTINTIQSLLKYGAK
jgi:hypothetical protein